MCDDAKAVIERVRAQNHFDFAIRDIRDDARDFAEYQYAIPVIKVNDVEIARYRLTEDQLQRALYDGIG